jgi:hypothetical protein
MSISYPVEYKGTAFGDPAKFASKAVTPVSSNNLADTAAAAVTLSTKKIADQVVLSSKALALSASQTAGYKGTAFGDPV